MIRVRPADYQDGGGTSIPAFIGECQPWSLIKFV